MLLTELTKISYLGARKPLSLWQSEYERLRASFLSETESLSSRLHETQTRSRWDSFLRTLREESPLELEVAQACSELAGILSRADNVSPEHVRIEKFVKESSAFVELAKKTSFFVEQRRKLKNTLTPAQQEEYDLQLFNHEGMGYFLEYYLEIYKQIQDAPTREAKMKFIEEKELILEFGAVDGLKQEFTRHETLDKFLYLILRDSLREEMITAYFETRRHVVTDQEISLEAFMESFKHMILVMLSTFELIGITRLSSKFYTPYGRAALISEVKTLL